MSRQQRQQRMRGRAGDNFQAPGILEFRKRCDEIFLVRKIEITNVAKLFVIQLRQLVQRLVPMRAVQFLFREVDELRDLHGRIEAGRRFSLERLQNLLSELQGKIV